MSAVAVDKPAGLELMELIRDGQLPPPYAALLLGLEIDEVGIHIDHTFALDDVAEALAHVGEGRALGKVVVAP